MYPRATGRNSLRSLVRSGGDTSSAWTCMPQGSLPGSPPLSLSPSPLPFPSPGSSASSLSCPNQTTHFFYFALSPSSPSIFSHTDDRSLAPHQGGCRLFPTTPHMTTILQKDEPISSFSVQLGSG